MTTMNSGFTQKYALIQLFEPVPEGTVYDWKDWPLHVTIADVFAIDWDVPTMTQKLTDLLDTMQSVVATVQDDTFFGENGGVRVALIERTDELAKLHYDVVELLEHGGWKPNSPEYSRAGFLPHSTVQKHARLNRGDKVVFDALTLIDFFPGSDPYKRKVVKTIKLGSRL